MGVKSFLNAINIVKPDLNHPYIRDCYIESRKIYKDLPEINDNEREYFIPGKHLDPFAGVRERIYIKNLMILERIN